MTEDEIQAHRAKVFEEMQRDFHKVKFDVGTGEIFTKQIDNAGREWNDGTPMEPPLGYKRQPTMVEIVREQIRSHHLAMLAMENDLETFEEADDFDVGDDYDPRTAYENDFDPSVEELIKAGRESVELRTAEEAKAKATKKAKVKKQPPVEDDDEDPAEE